MPAEEKTQFLGHENHYADRNTALVIPYDDYYILDASAGDAEAPKAAVKGGADIQNDWRNCRYIKVDTGGIVKIDYMNKNSETITEVLTLLTGVPHPVRNVIKLYQYYNKQAEGTAKVYDRSGAELTNAIKLLR